MELLLSEKITYSTVRILCELTDGTEATGSGFFYTFKKVNGAKVTAIVTNKHVIKDAKVGHFYLTRQNEGLPLTGQFIPVKMDNFENLWIKHPNPDVDLCVMLIEDIFFKANISGNSLYIVTLDDSLLPTSTDLNDFSAMEEILMVGYPIGIWDSINNMPILRRGITATHANLDYNGKKEFLIDAACFPGSSGSPVFLYNQSGWQRREGTLQLGSIRIRFLGILYAGPQFAATGEVQIIDIPTQQRMITLSEIPINLGYVIKSIRLNDFIDLL